MLSSINRKFATQSKPLQDLRSKVTQLGAKTGSAVSKMSRSVSPGEVRKLSGSEVRHLFAAVGFRVSFHSDHDMVERGQAKLMVNCMYNLPANYYGP